ncbi:MAG: tRNA dihydrouridine synthase DusB [Bacteroidales bacterium]|jgi:nifR3 family TIM-barrel protein|nr:tRNA dihydrouridine synthase DusB [Bacteroidales bacterium]
MLRIGNAEFEDKPVFLAPMEDITDPSFRYMCKKFGADLMFTEFISSDGLIRDAKKSIQKLDIFDYERPVGIQIYGHIPEAMQQAAEVVNSACPDLLDINYGCPVKKIATRGAGSGMMKDLPLMRDITERVVKTSKFPVTAKTRLGWDSENLNVQDVALLLQDCGIQALTIHGRTRAQMYKGEADWTLIGKIKNDPQIKIPIIGNGDITNGKVAAGCFEKFGVDAIMIGRAAIGKPWIFKEVKHFLKTGEELPQPGVLERIEFAREHLQKSIEYKEDKRGIYEMRRHFNLYFKGIPNFKETRLKLLTAQTVEEIKILLDYIEDKFGNSYIEIPDTEYII